MKVNKDLRNRYEEFLFEFLKIIKKEKWIKGENFLKLFRKIVLLKDSPSLELEIENEREKFFAYKGVLEDTELTPEIVSLIEETFLDERFIWTIGDFLNLLLAKRIKISKNVIDKLCESVLEEKLFSDYAETLCFYIKHLNLKEYCGFLKDLIDMLVKNLDYKVYSIVKVAAEMGCLNCYDSIKKVLTSGERNGRALSWASKGLKKLDKLRVTKEIEKKFEIFVQRVINYKDEKELFVFEDFLKIYEEEIGLRKPEDYISNKNPELFSSYFINLDGRDLVMVERFLLDVKYSWLFSYFLRLLVLLESKISNETLDKLKDLSIEENISKENIKNLIEYIKKLRIAGYDDFVEKFENN